MTISSQTTTGTHHALFQVLQAATLLINVVIDCAKEAKLSADVKTAINAFAKEMNFVQGIIQSVAQRKPEMRHVLEPMDARIISSCDNRCGSYAMSFGRYLPQNTACVV